MLENFVRRLHDPFEMENFAPRGYEMLLAASLGPHFKLHGERVNAFLKHAHFFKDEADTDYRFAAAQSITLSKEPIEFSDSLVGALFNRKSVRDFRLKKTDLATLSFFLKMSAGFKDMNNPELGRMYPSGGGLYTLRIYVDVRDIEGIESGVYIFNPFKNTLDLVNSDIDDDLRLKLHNNSHELSLLKNTNFEILISTRPTVALRKYGEHAWKVILMEMGHLAQNFWLVGIGCGYSAFPCTSLNLQASENFLRTSAKGELLLHSLFFGSAEEQVLSP